MSIAATILASSFTILAPPATAPPPVQRPAERNDVEIPSVDLEPSATRPRRKLPTYATEGHTYTVTPAQEGPPFYGEADTEVLRERHGLEPMPTEKPRTARWKCLVPDQTCGFTAEINATSAFALRARQGDVSVPDDVVRWNSGRVQYDLWLDIPLLQEVVGTHKFTRMTLGPKGGVIASDSHDLWGNVGLAGRYFFTRGAWSPTIEWSAALTFQTFDQGRCAVEGRDGPTTEACLANRRSPVGITADVGVGVGGWGAVVVGGQFDTPLAREDLPEQFRIASGGMFFVGFRGNILWGAPAAAAVATHAVVQRSVDDP